MRRNIVWGVLSLALLALMGSACALAQAPVIGSTVNATVGYQLGGNAPATHTLCGNGTVYVDSATPCTTAATVFYQTVESNGSAETQRPAWNYSAFFTLTDSASPARTNVDAAHVGAAGACAHPSSITLDVYGRTTACTAGTAVVVATANFTSCAFVSAGSTDQNCVGVGTWSSTIAGSYSVSCIIGVPFAGPSGTADSSGLTQTTWGLSGASPLGTTSFNYYIANQHSAAVGLTVTMSCIAVQ